MANIREDFVGAVHVDGYVLTAGDEIPDGVTVGSHLMGESEPAPAEVPEGDDFDPLAEESEPAPAKPRGRPRKAQ